jgi:ABC-2 type transport system permease protein
MLRVPQDAPVPQNSQVPQPQKRAGGLWPLRIILSRLRPVNAASITRTGIVVFVVALFLLGDYALFYRLFTRMAEVEAETPLFVLALLRNLLSLVYLVATVILFSSSLTVAIGAYFTDLDLDIYHAAPRSKLGIALGRWVKTLLQSTTIVFLFLIPMILAFAAVYDRPLLRHVAVVANLMLLFTIPVSAASIVILLLVRWFPVSRVHQIVATLAVLILTVVVIAFRVSRPERLFRDVTTGDAMTALRSIELPAMSIYPSSAVAELMTSASAASIQLRVLLPALLLFAAFVLIARASYFTAFVRARESMAPMAIGAVQTTRLLDRLLARARPQWRALLGKEARTITRDVGQWSQVLLMGALLFIYLYNVRMLPLGGDARATLVAYANVGMAGFVVAAICLRFAYPSVSAEGKAFWLVQTAPVSYRQFLFVKVLVFAAPLTLVSVVLTALANLMLGANGTVWAFTLLGAVLLAVTLVCLGVGMGALSPDFNSENPLQVGLSLGGFSYMAISMAYVATVMVLMARPVMRYFTRRFLPSETIEPIAVALPIVIALTLSAALSVIPIRIAEHRLKQLKEND